MCQNKRVKNVAIFGGALSMYIIALSMYIIRLYIYIYIYIYIGLDKTVITLVEVTVIEPVCLKPLQESCIHINKFRFLLAQIHSKQVTSWS